MLVDDEAEFLKTLAERVRARGLDVSTAESAKDALAKVEKGTYDAVVLDLQMPGMDGLEALRILKEKDPKLQVILLTGHATVEKGVEAMKRGALDLLEKPANIETLRQKIQEATARRLVLVSEQAEDKIKDIIASKGW
ncbi:MAG: response regulator [Chromatiales bacterium]|nr:response regulator [Chromatiales bacterium]